MNKNIYTLVLAILLVSCGNENVEGIRGAKGETPVRYVICDAGEADCFVSARFKDLDGCESHKKWSEMLCDSVSHPGQMICEKNNKPQIVFSYCTL